MDPVILLVAALCLAAGIALGWFAAHSRASGQQGALSARAAAAESAAAAARAELERQGGLYREFVERQRAEQRERDDRDRRENAVVAALAPVRDTLAQVRVKVDDLERERHAQYGALAEQLRRAQETDDLLRDTTASLSSALRSTSTRGVWGEVQLRRVVEAAGLTRHVDFDVQSSISSDAGSGRPDMIVRLPGGKAIAVDAKVPLDAFIESQAIADTAQGEDAVRRRALRDKHVKALRAHIDALAKKQYWAGIESSPEFVICFVPNEALLATALDEDPALLDYAFRQRVALASPVNLWAVLRTVAYTWTQEAVSDDARELFTLGTQLYERLGGLTKHIDDLRRGIERTVDGYNRFVGSLESRVLVTARRFPGIDETKLDAVAAPAALESTPRRLSAPEFTAALDEVRRAASADADEAASADETQLPASPA
ncbi:DNA recombination protein RmuC [Microbacterium sp. SORGH_AS428]|uniref:DNA recombination protein RmuC n=1 Tax=Microbacterium sp. SORGH_AS_0428 TaxID=3041788 RepID=UPI0028581BE0|nr:DNA recombination protein RmuC [Microbacterium sp. SORGH_AS_0428]MDR6201089.1 DNA recombination protein RmuC [Microbacterium sp. SORGH_AS_0428]